MNPRHHIVDMSSTKGRKLQQNTRPMPENSYYNEIITFKGAFIAFLLFISITHLVSLIKVYSWSDYLEPLEFQKNVRQDPLMMKQMRPFHEQGWRSKRIEEQVKKLNPVVPGWGENGVGVALLDNEQVKQSRMQFQKTYYNNYIAERISMNRTVPRVANEHCNNITYDLSKLPTVSIVIIFHNEVFPVLMRTVWSIITRSPKNLLREIILVDDLSDWPEYQSSFLEDYIRFIINSIPRHERFFNPEAGPLVKLVRLGSRNGLIRAKLEGARRATGDVLQFMDAHVEVTDGWLEPILQRIREDRKVFVIPILDEINMRTMRYNHNGDTYRRYSAGFHWLGIFQWELRDKDEVDNTSPEKPLSSATMHGGLFGVDRQYFWEIGAYDEEMQIWGAENLEMSFRVWQCGGRIEMHPCSRVAHLSRSTTIYNEDLTMGYNWHRTAAVWMDSYISYAKLHNPTLNMISAGNLSGRRELRKRLKCHDFEWYLRVAYKNNKFIPDKNVRAYGRLSNPHTNLCVDTLRKIEGSYEAVGLRKCMKHNVNFITTQDWSYMNNSDMLRRDTTCLINGMIMKQYGILNIEREDPKKVSTTKATPIPKNVFEAARFDQIIDNQQRKISWKKINQTIYPKVENIFKEKSSYIVYMLECTIVEHPPASRSHFDWERKLVPNSVDLFVIKSKASNLCMTSKQLTKAGPKPGQQHLLAVNFCNISDPHQHWKFQHDLESPYYMGDKVNV